MSFYERHMSSVEILVIIALVSCRIVYKWRPHRASDKSVTMDKSERAPFLDFSDGSRSRVGSGTASSNRRNAREEREKSGNSRNESPVSIMAGDV